ncbi:MAG: sulfate adenylyltransferase subunit CysN, partial [Alloprevotella sp.]|nr:sulfate adenylyltransferase subunit CysN [Alloprevotella sp.]
HTTNTSRSRIDGVEYRVDVNTMEHKDADLLRLNEIGLARFQTSKPLFFDAYKQNKPTGSFVLIDPITNNTSAVGMILRPLEENALHLDSNMPVLDLPRLGIGKEHYEAIDRAVKELERQGWGIKVVKD